MLGYGYKQYYGYNVTKQTYGYQLTRSLYYQNLDNNAGVFYHLIDKAEEQECREVILAYFCLWRSAATGWTSADLDDYIELELERLANLKVDFEIGDALEKLDRLGLVEKTGDRYRAKPLQAAQERLDYLWDNYFQYNKAPANAVAAFARRRVCFTRLLAKAATNLGRRLPSTISPAVGQAIEIQHRDEQAGTPAHNQQKPAVGEAAHPLSRTGEVQQRKQGQRQLERQDHLTEHQQVGHAAVAAQADDEHGRDDGQKPGEQSPQPRLDPPRMNPSITTWPASVPVTVLLWPLANSATANSVLANAVPNNGASVR